MCGNMKTIGLKYLLLFACSSSVNVISPIIDGTAC